MSGMDIDISEHNVTPHEESKENLQQAFNQAKGLLPNDILPFVEVTVKGLKTRHDLPKSLVPTTTGHLGTDDVVKMEGQCRMVRENDIFESIITEKSRSLQDSKILYILPNVEVLHVLTVDQRIKLACILKRELAKPPFNIPPFEENLLGNFYHCGMLCGLDVRGENKARAIFRNDCW